MKTTFALIGRKQQGMSLIEVLVAVLVLALGLLGLAMLQTAGLRLTTDSYSRSQATFLAYDIIERMRANQAGFIAGNYDIDDATEAATAYSTYRTCKGSTCACDTSACTSATLAQYDLGKWYEQQYGNDGTDGSTARAALLTGAKFAADVDGRRATIVRNGNAVTVTLYWKEQEERKTQIWNAEFGS